MILTREGYPQNNRPVQTTGCTIIDIPLQEFLRELVDNKKLADLHILTSFAFTQSSKDSKQHEKSFKGLVGEISRHNIKVRYGIDIEKLSVLVRLYINCNFDIYNGDILMLRRVLIEESADILRYDFNIRLNSLSSVEMNVLAFFINFIRMKIEYSHNMKPGHSGSGEFLGKFCCVLNGMIIYCDNGNDYYVFDDLREKTIIFKEIFDQELENDDKIIKIDIIERDSCRITGTINYCRFGDIIVKAGIGYWVVDNNSNKLIVPKFLYDIASACDRIPLDIKDFDVRVKRMENMLKGKDLDLIYNRENDFDNKCVLTDGSGGIEGKIEQLDKEYNIFGIEYYTEKDIEDYLCENITVLEEGLEIIGNQYVTDRDRIDILCKDKNNIYTVVEIKVRDKRDKVFGQIIGYMSWVKKHLSKDMIVRGIIVIDNYDEKLESRLESIIEITKLDIKIKILDIK